MHGSSGVQVSAGAPPSGAYSNVAGALEVTVSAPGRMHFARLLLGTAPTVSGKAVAAPTAVTCVMALGTTGTILPMNSNARINLPNCDLFNNSSSSTGTTLDSNANITAQNIRLAGNYTTASNASVTVSGTLERNAGPAQDPYADRTPPAYSGCDQNDFPLGGNDKSPWPPMAGLMCSAAPRRWIAARSLH